MEFGRGSFHSNRKLQHVRKQDPVAELVRKIRYLKLKHDIVKKVISIFSQIGRCFILPSESK
jgi:hypothetical protein